MTNGEKIKEIFSDCFIVRRLSDNKIVHLVCTEEFLNSEYKESTNKNDLAHNLCGTCINYKCEFQSGIVRTKCAFYMPPTESNCSEIPTGSTAKNNIDFKLNDYVSREAVRRIIKSPRTQEQMLNVLNSLRNATECKAEDCINREYTAKYVEEFANNEYVSQDEAETIYLIADGIRHIPSALPDVHDNNVGNIDCISREQALKELKESAEHHANDSREEVLLRRDRDIIRALPSVTPQEPILDQITEIIEPLRHLPIGEMSDIEWDILRVIDKYKGESEDNGNDD